MIVIPAPYQVRDKLQPESRVPGGNRDPVFEMVPGFCQVDAWTPVFTGETTFYETIRRYELNLRHRSEWILKQ